MADAAVASAHAWRRELTAPASSFLLLAETCGDLFGLGGVLPRRYDFCGEAGLRKQNPIGQIARDRGVERRIADLTYRGMLVPFASGWCPSLSSGRGRCTRDQGNCGLGQLSEG